MFYPLLFSHKHGGLPGLFALVPMRLSVSSLVSLQSFIHVCCSDKVKKTGQVVGVLHLSTQQRPYSCICLLQRQGEEDGTGSALHLSAGPPHPQHQGRALHPNHHSTEAGSRMLKSHFYVSFWLIYCSKREWSDLSTLPVTQSLLHIVFVGVVDTHWLQCVSVSSLLSHCGSGYGSGSRNSNQRGSRRIRIHILVKIFSHKKFYIKNILKLGNRSKIYKRRYKAFL